MVEVIEYVNEDPALQPELEELELKFMNRDDDKLNGNLDVLDEVLPENNTSGEETQEISKDSGEDKDLIKSEKDEAMDEEDAIAEEEDLDESLLVEMKGKRE
eukprot:5371443-Ditylum_brightwellii.AAC.1